MSEVTIMEKLFEAIDVMMARGAEPVVVSLGGPSASGKSTAMRQFNQRYPACLTLSADDYYIGKTRMRAELPAEIASNFDHPSAIGLTALRNHILDLRHGRSIERPSYDMLTSEPRPDLIHADGQGIALIVVEGIVANLPVLADVVDIHAAVSRPLEARLKHRIERDTIRKGYSAEQITNYIMNVAEPAYQQHYKQYDDQAEFIINS